MDIHLSTKYRFLGVINTMTGVGAGGSRSPAPQRGRSAAGDTAATDGRHSVGRAQFLERFVPAAAIAEFDVEMFGIEPEHRHGPQQRTGEATVVFAPRRPERLRPALADTMSETETALVAES